VGIRDRLTKEEYEHVTVRQTIEARKAGYLMTDGSLAFIFYSLKSRKSVRGKADKGPNPREVP
jgi:hypothetical protein